MVNEPNIIFVYNLVLVIFRKYLLIIRLYCRTSKKEAVFLWHFVFLTFCLKRPCQTLCKEKKKISLAFSDVFMAKLGRIALFPQIHSPFLWESMIFFQDCIFFPQLHLSMFMWLSSCWWNITARDLCYSQSTAIEVLAASTSWKLHSAANQADQEASSKAPLTYWGRHAYHWGSN